jgi:predicted anti-sigma-YlaC factor YlaD
MRDWFELLCKRSALDWGRNIAASLAELETGLQMIANSQKRRRWHLAPCLAVLALAIAVSHPGRLKTL